MNWGAFDLNLLIVFDAIMRERNVTRAGQAVGLSQPAMSHALSRLRYRLKDDLFIRTPDGMMPTPRAEQLAAPLREALNELQAALEPPSFDPVRADRRFTITVNNHAAIVVAPSLVVSATEIAPGVQLDLRPSGSLDIADLLDRGELDLAIGGYGDIGERFRCQPLLVDDTVLTMRRDHPAAGLDLTPEVVASLPFLAISSGAIDPSFFDEWLAENGLSQRIAARAPRLAAADILRRSDLVAIATRRAAAALSRDGVLAIRELPCGGPTMVIAMLWHRRLDRHPALAWLRELTETVCRNL